MTVAVHSSLDTGALATCIAKVSDISITISMTFIKRLLDTAWDVPPTSRSLAVLKQDETWPM